MLACHLLLLLIVLAAASRAHRRLPEKLFADTMYLAGHTITCDNDKERTKKQYFEGDTWTCYNIKVDGKRLRYWYLSGFGAETECSDGPDNYDSRNDMAALCRHMLKAHGIDRELWAAFVNEPSCNHLDDTRMIFVQQDSEYVWEQFNPGHGYFKTLRCQTHDKKS